jgi:hypothetical protein
MSEPLDDRVILEKLRSKPVSLYTIGELEFIQENLSHKGSWGVTCPEEAEIVLRILERLKELADR